jgi:hypothetical protein
MNFALGQFAIWIYLGSEAEPGNPNASHFPASPKRASTWDWPLSPIVLD